MKLLKAYVSNVYFEDSAFCVIFFCFQEKLAILSIVIQRSQVSIVCNVTVLFIQQIYVRPQKSATHCANIAKNAFHIFGQICLRAPRKVYFTAYSLKMSILFIIFWGKKRKEVCIKMKSKHFR